MSIPTPNMPYGTFTTWTGNIRRETKTIYHAQGDREVVDEQWYTYESMAGGKGALIQGQLTPAGGSSRRVRRPTNWRRIAYRCSPGEKQYKDVFEFDGKPYLTTTITEQYVSGALGPKGSSLIAGYACLHSEDAKNQSITQALNNLGDQKVNIGASLGEARKTLDSIADTSIQLFRSYRALRQRDWGGVADALGLRNRDWLTGKSSAQRLLEIKYGWKPLLSSIYDGYQWFGQNPDPLYTFSVASSGASHHENWQETVGYEDLTGSHITEAITSLKYAVNNEYLRNQNQGGLENPVQIAWEVVPYSFVLDWWLPVGNVLQAYSDTRGCDFVSGYTSLRSSASVKQKEERTSSGQSWKSSSSRDWFTFDRAAHTSFPTPDIYQKQNWFNMNKGVTALALFRQLFK